MSVVRGVLNVAGDVLMFWCPGCDIAHGVNSTWAFNEDYEKPTFSPSVLATGSEWEGKRCHSFVNQGRIQFLTDSTHDLAGQTVAIPAWPFEEEGGPR